MAKKHIDAAEGLAAVRAAVKAGQQIDRVTLALAVRYLLQLLTQLHPGNSVEVRVPPFGAVQVIEGTTHRRGTPPAVIEMSPATWIALATGAVRWHEAIERNLVDASGVRADLEAYLPLVRALA